jgi:hypothetical protein
VTAAHIYRSQPSGFQEVVDAFLKREAVIGRRPRIEIEFGSNKRLGNCGQGAGFFGFA